MEVKKCLILVRYYKRKVISLFLVAQSLQRWCTNSWGSAITLEVGTLSRMGERMGGGSMGGWEDGRWEDGR